MQTELFDLPSSQNTVEEDIAPKASFLEKTCLTLRLDQAIGLLLVLMVLFVLVFSWGVEKGKQSVSELKTVVPIVTPLASPAVQAPVKEPLAVAGKEVIPHEIPITVEALPKPVAKVNVPEGKYTIQHVTYVTQSAADREIQKLGKQGYSSFVIPSGKHIQVCIAAFQTRSEAIKLLKQLQSRHLVSGDAYVRPITR